jgi:hypothetical protein
MDGRISRHPFEGEDPFQEHGHEKEGRGLFPLIFYLDSSFFLCLQENTRSIRDWIDKEKKA